MFLKLKNGELNYILIKAIEKSGSIRKLEKILKISKSNLAEYKHEKRLINKNVLLKILSYLNLNIKKIHIEKELRDNWRQVKGGLISVRIKKKKGIFKKQLEKCHLASSTYMKNLHYRLKKENPEKYYKAQYEKFKKIGHYKYITLNKEKVRNKLEKETADELKNRGISYSYEPLIKVRKNIFFPDFLIEPNTIIECTTWRGFDKAIKLKDKIDILKAKYKVYVLIPKALNNYYKILNSHLVFELNDVPVAQSF